MAESTITTMMIYQELHGVLVEELGLDNHLHFYQEAHMFFSPLTKDILAF